MSEITHYYRNFRAAAAEIPDETNGYHVRAHHIRTHQATNGTWLISVRPLDTEPEDDQEFSLHKDTATALAFDLLAAIEEIEETDA
jgi:hypothetical protein